MVGINLGIVSQTPVIRFLSEHKRETIDISDLDKGEYTDTVGGVTPLIKAQLDELMVHGIVNKAIWFSLNPNAPRKIVLSKWIDAVSIHMEGESSKDYVNFKEEIWNNIHGFSSRAFTVKEYLGYFRYNSKLARIILQDYEDINIFEIHDFQQLLLGSMLGPSFPSVLRWHIPFVPERVNRKIKKFIINGMEGNDAVIVSTKRDLEGLIRAGYRGSAYQIYPHIDQTIWKKATKGKMEGVMERLGIKPDHFVVVNVARMDMIKSQDDLVRSAALLKKEKIKIVLVGGASFSSSPSGLGHNKSELWLKRLRALAKKLGVENTVVFAGLLDHSELECIYSRADLFVLPSRTEGFGLAVAEAWLYGVPAIVSGGAGISELVTDGLNGYTFKPGDFKALAIKILQLYKNGRLKTEMGRNARNMAMACYVSATAPLIKEVYEKTIDDFG